ncbi:MAG: hypothetical protein ACLT5B_05060 [Clostridia bacterium]
MKNSSPKKSKKILKFIVFMLLVILLSVLIKINYTDAQRKVALENTIADMASLNSKQTFSIDKIYTALQMRQTMKRKSQCGI